MKLDLNQTVKNLGGFDFIERINVAEAGQPEKLEDRPQSLRSMLVAGMLGCYKPEDPIEIRDKRARIVWKIQKSKKTVSLTVPDIAFVIDECRKFYADFAYIPLLHILDSEKFEEPAEESESSE